MRQQSAHFGKEEKPSYKRCDATVVASRVDMLELRRHGDVKASTGSLRLRERAAAGTA